MGFRLVIFQKHLPAINQHIKDNLLITKMLRTYHFQISAQKKE